ncbi:hypothetical protein ACKI1K_43455 [Streptomyces scabiei]|uniref:hypothetical protein n=1 Tax=Streptomyces scabiei TaxID=1930 RepID=UPI0038F5EFE3
MKREQHGMTDTPEYRAWKDMKSRCNNQRHKHFKDYGARGIKVFDKWNESFTAFYNYIGPRPDGTSLDRIDNSKGYEPGNVRWATAFEQSNNTRRNRANRTHCKNGHPITPENTYEMASGGSCCIVCHNLWKKNNSERVKMVNRKSRKQREERQRNEAADRFVRLIYCLDAT